MAVRPLPDQLGELSELVGGMCAAASAAMRDATAALVDGRPRLAEQVIAGNAGLDGLSERIETLASEALLLHSPVAGDLRAVVAAIHCCDDVVRMARLAVLVAEAARPDRRRVPVEVLPALREMGRCAVALGVKAAQVARSRNVLLAVELDAEDDATDDLHRRMFSVMMHPSWPHGVAAAVEVTLLARYYERFADHAVKVARQTVYAVTGRAPESLAL
ncbi:MAG: phosphate signaling complex PhoU family protein [Pseudonocardia sp.]